MEGIIVGAVLGAALAIAGWFLAHLVATAIRNRNSTQIGKRPGWPYTVAIALAIACTAALRPHATEYWNKLTIDWRADEFMASVESSYPIYRTIRENEPALYNEIRQELIASIKRDDNPDQSIDRARAPLINYVAANMALVPDEVIVSLIKITVLEARSLGQSNPRMCVELLNGRVSGDIRPFIPDDLERQELAVMEELILAPKMAGRKAMTEEAASELSLEIILRKVSETGIPISDFVEAHTGSLDPAKACAALAEFMSGIADLPPEQAGPMWRSASAAAVQ